MTIAHTPYPPLPANHSMWCLYNKLFNTAHQATINNKQRLPNQQQPNVSHRALPGNEDYGMCRAKTNNAV